MGFRGIAPLPSVSGRAQGSFFIAGAWLPPWGKCQAAAESVRKHSSVPDPPCRAPLGSSPTGEARVGPGPSLLLWMRGTSPRAMLLFFSSVFQGRSGRPVISGPFRLLFPLPALPPRRREPGALGFRPCAAGGFRACSPSSRQRRIDRRPLPTDRWSC